MPNKDLRETLEDLRVPIAPPGHHHARRGWVQINCPFCWNGDTAHQWHMGLSETTRAVNCWRCGRHQLRTVLAALGATPRAIRAAAVARLHLGPHRPPGHTGRLQIPRGVGPLAPAHNLYLHNRGFDPVQLTRLWEIGGITHHARLGWRLFIPIHLHGEVVSWTTRAINDTGQRWVSAPTAHETVPAGRLVYGIDYVRHWAIIVEGPTDVWRVGPGAVATLGTAVTPAQTAVLARVPVRVVCFDRHPAAQRAADALCRTLAPYPGTTTNVVLDAPDPGDASNAAVRLLRTLAVLGHEWAGGADHVGNGFSEGRTQPKRLAGNN